MVLNAGTLNKINAQLLFAKPQNIRTVRNSVMLVGDQSKTEEGKLLSQDGSEFLELAAMVLGRQMVN